MDQTATDIFEVMHIADFPHTLSLVGDHPKFRTPRLPGERIPVFVLPPAEVVNCEMSIDKQQKLQLDLRMNTDTMRRAQDWLSRGAFDAMCATTQTAYDLVRPNGTLRVRAHPVESVEVTDAEGRPIETPAITQVQGCLVQCAVDVPVVWLNDTQIGMTFNVVQLRVLKGRTCLIEDEEDDNNSTARPSYRIQMTPYEPLEMNVESVADSSSYEPYVPLRH